MGTAVSDLLLRDSSYDTMLEVGARPDIAELQLAAADQRFHEQRGRIPLLDHRAEKANIQTISHRESLVPLLFAHTAYKSYPESLLTSRRWDRMSAWVSTISTADVSGVDLTGVVDIDEWLDRLAAEGVHLNVSSGTSGKMSFIPMSDDDIELNIDLTVKTTGFPRRLAAAHDRPVLAFAPSNSASRFRYTYRAWADAFGRPGAIHSLSDERVLVADQLRETRLRRAMAGGEASPEDIAHYESITAARAAAAQASLADLTDLALDYRSEPQLIVGYWATMWEFMTIAKKRGIPCGAFHPETVVWSVGGLKGLSLPADYEKQFAGFVGDVIRWRKYGMSEAIEGMSMCEAGVFHCNPWIMLFVLDETGERLLEPRSDGRVQGRCGFFDGSWSGHWGGVVTGDRVTANFSPTCACGRPGPTIENSIVRYSEITGAADDKLTCGGTIDQYIRGVLA
jgi:hypothetical protein